MGGTTAGGCIIPLIAKGGMDVNLTSDPQVTFFRCATQKHTNFGSELVQQTFTNTVAFGNEVQITLNRCGDLLAKVYVEVHLPAIAAVWNKHNGHGTYGSCCAFPVEEPCDPCGDGELRCAPCNENKSHTRVQGGVFGHDGGSGSSYSDYGSSSGDYYGDTPSSSSCGSSSSSTGCGTSSSSSTGCGSSSDSSSYSSSSTDSCTGIRGPWAHWVNAIGHALIERSQFSIGGQVIDTCYGMFMHIWDELTAPAGKHLRKMIGKFNTTAELVAYSQAPQVLYVPLPYYFTQDYCDAFPIVSCQFHQFQISVKFSNLEKCIVVSHENVQVVRCVDGAVITKQDLNAHLDSRYIYLDMEERDMFACGSFNQAIKQVQSYSQTASRTNNCHAILNFNHPTLALIWVGQRKCKAERGGTFDFSGKYGLAPFTNCALTLNSLTVFNHHASYFQLVEPYEHFTNVQNYNYIYSYSFALHPESHQPSGSVNFSRIDSIEMQFCFQGAIAHEDLAIYVFAISWNILKYKDGLGGLMYSSNPMCSGSDLAITWI
jgi:hypothetical protein